MRRETASGHWEYIDGFGWWWYFDMPAWRDPDLVPDAFDLLPAPAEEGPPT